MTMRRMFGKDRGSVMMEYIILNFWLVLALVVGGYFFIDPADDGGQRTSRLDPETGAFLSDAGKTARFGRLGSNFLARYGLMLRIVSMPYP